MVLRKSLYPLIPNTSKPGTSNTRTKQIRVVKIAFLIVYMQNRCANQQPKTCFHFTARRFCHVSHASRRWGSQTRSAGKPAFLHKHRDSRARLCAPFTNTPKHIHRLNAYYKYIYIWYVKIIASPQTPKNYTKTLSHKTRLDKNITE